MAWHFTGWAAIASGPKNEAYYGTLVLGGQPGHPAIRSGVEPVRVENAWPAVIDKETVLAIEATMTGKRPENTHPRFVSSNFLLSGLVFCSCGHAMIGRSAKSHQYYYYHVTATTSRERRHVLPETCPKTD